MEDLIIWTKSKKADRVCKKKSVFFLTARGKWKYLLRNNVSHQSEDQVVEGCGRQQKQQNGEEQSPDEELWQETLQHS